MTEIAGPSGPGPYLFDVGVTTLAHAETPVSDRPLSYVRKAIQGEIDAVVPYASLVGAHHMLVRIYGFSNAEATALMSRFMDAGRVHWHDGMGKSTVRAGFELAGDVNVDGWDGYYAQVARAEGVGTVLTLDADFERIDGFETEVILTPDEFETLTDYLEA